MPDVTELKKNIVGRNVLTLKTFMWIERENEESYIVSMLFLWPVNKPRLIVWLIRAK